MIMMRDAGAIAVPLQAARPRDLALHQALAFAVGFLLPLLTLKTGYYGTPTDIASRVSLVDFACLLLLALIVVRSSPAPVPIPGAVYFFALVVSLIPALVFYDQRESYAWISFSALVMAFLFYVLGLTVGRSPAVTQSLLAGVAVVTLLEAVVVYHDYFFASQWFPDPMEGRARGTFKANGQLGAYGFCAAGMLLTLGPGVASRRLRILCILSGFVAASFVWTASRRTGMICVFLWAVLFAVLGVRFAHRRFYRVFVAFLVAGILAMGISWTTLSQSFAGQRLTEGLSGLSRKDGFIQNQHKAIIATSDQWFPFGFGPGRGSRINPYDIGRHEIHNGLLAVLVELGVLGFLGFVAMAARPLFRRRGFGLPPLQATILLSFLAISFVFMFHNTLYRDRTFLLFLGMATAMALQQTLPPPPAPPKRLGERAREPEVVR
jgi:O-antigen ligase